MDARFHLGEVLWQLGRLPDAIACWREAARLAPEHPAAQMALAEALLGTGDAASAGAVAARYVERHPQDMRARAIAAVAALATADDRAAAQAVAAALAAAPELLAVVSIAGSLAQALDRTSNRDGRATVLEAIVASGVDRAHAASMPASLVAQVCEHLLVRTPATHAALAAWLAVALVRPWVSRDHDALRRVADVAVSAQSPHAPEFAAHYAQLCELAEAMPSPLVWPQRTQGERLRVLVLSAANMQNHAARATHAAIAALAPERFDVTLMAVGGPTPPQVTRVATFDPDVVVDLAGLAAPIGALLAQRPARSRVAIAASAQHNVAPLVDHVVADAGELGALLESMRTSLPAAAAALPDAGALADLWAAAVTAHQRGDRAAALRLYAEVQDAQPRYAPAHYLMGVALREDAQLAAARACFAAALAYAPRHVDARIAAIRAAVDAHALADADALAREGAALYADPPPPLLRAWGAARLAAHDGKAAADLFEAALAREPIDGETHYNHGVALQMERRNADAARAYQRALMFRPDLVAADFNLGVIFGEDGNREGAIRAFSNVIERDPKHVAAYRNRGELLFAAGRLDEWRANFGRFEAKCPDALPLAVHALEVCQHSGEFRRVEHYLEGLRKERYHAADERELVDSLEELLYLLLFFDVEPELIQRFAQTYDDAARRVYGEPLPMAAQRRAGKMRIGYLSADLRDHVMGKMIWQAVAQHDRAAFELHFYSLSAQRDEWTEKFVAIAAGYTVLAGMTERAAARTIADADLDLLVDLSTHTKGALPGILALKPARVQITYVASAGTVGLSTIDFKLTDRYCDIMQERPARTETLLPMDGCVYPYRHVGPAREHRYRREAFAIAADAIVIGAFVTSLKLSRRCLSLWRDVLARIPRARIAFSPLNPAWRDVYVQLAAAGGIGAERLVFIPQGGSDALNQARYHLVDFVLDPMPYGGVNGTLEALDMGVPVVTLVGGRHAERTSYSILTNLGVTQTLAQSGKEYVDIATRLAGDATFSAEVRSAIRAGLAKSSLTDMPAHTRRLETAYREALRLRGHAVPVSVEAGEATR